MSKEARQLKISSGLDGGKGGNTGKGQGPAAAGRVRRRRSKSGPSHASLVAEDSAPNAGRDGRLTNAVVKIFATHCEPDYAVPWTTQGQESSISSGFAFQVPSSSEIPKGLKQERLLLTNAHCVEHAAVVQVRPRGSGIRYVASVLSIANDCDLALLTVEDDEFWRDVEKLELVSGSDPPQPGQTVTVIGFPTGGDNTCVTQGVVSRLDLHDYVQSGKEFLAVQVDAAINAGNSGGPALNKKGKCVGVAFQSDSDEDIENQGQIIPTEIILHFLADWVKNGKYTGFPHPGFHTQSLESAALREFVGLSKGQSGVRIIRVEPAGPAHGKVQVGDILIKVDKHDIGNDGNAAFRYGERLPMQYLFHRKFVGDTMPVTLVRDGTTLTVDLRLEAEQALVPVAVPGAPQYYIFGGLVLVPLTQPFLEHEFGADFDSEAPPALLSAWEDGTKEEERQELVVLTRVLAHGVNVGYEDVENEQVVKFQDAPVRNLRELAIEVETELRREDVVFLKLELANGDLVVLRRAESLQATTDILKRNLIASRGRLLDAGGAQCVTPDEMMAALQAAKEPPAAQADVGIVGEGGVSPAG